MKLITILSALALVTVPSIADARPIPVSIAAMKACKPIRAMSIEHADMFIRTTIAASGQKLPRQQVASVNRLLYSDAMDVQICRRADSFHLSLNRAIIKRS